MEFVRSTLSTTYGSTMRNESEANLEVFQHLKRKSTNEQCM